MLRATTRKRSQSHDFDYHSWNMLCSIYAALENEAGAVRAAQMAISGAERALAHDPTNGSALGTGVTGFGILKQGNARTNGSNGRC